MSGGVCGILGRNMGRGGGSRRRRSLSRSLPFLRQDFPEYAATRQCDADQPKDNDTAWRSAAGSCLRWVGWWGGGGGGEPHHKRTRQRARENTCHRRSLFEVCTRFFCG